MGRPPKKLAPFPASAAFAVTLAWFLGCLGVYYYIGFEVRCVTIPSDAPLVAAWFEMHSEIPVTIGTDKYKKRARLSFGKPGMQWLVGQAKEHGISESHFHTTLAQAEIRQKAFEEEKLTVKHEILEECYTRAGKRGCVDCGSEKYPQFDHVDRSQKTERVSFYLHRGEFEKARKEARNTVVRCEGHHQQKGAIEGEFVNGAPRKPLGDEKVEAARKRWRDGGDAPRKYGRARDTAAKVAAGKCHKCGKLCTADTIHHFRWNHRDPSTKKYIVSQMLTCSDEVYYEERNKCDLLCTDCHGDETRRQFDSGELALVSRKKKRLRLEINT